MRRIFVFFLLLTSSVSYAQRKEFKFGKGISEHLSKSVYAIDSAAEAVVLNEGGKLYFSANPFEYKLKIHRRVKILKPAAFDLANFSIFEYKKGNFHQKVRGLKAFSYNLVDGKEEKTKLDKKGIFREKVNDKGLKKLKFTLPKVKEGTVIDVTYEIISTSVTDIPNWTFQGKYPVLYSELEVSIPEFFQFMNISQGFHPLKQINDYGTLHIGSEVYNTKKTVWIAENVPALRKESFITTMSDYYTQIKFQLASTRFQGVHREVSGSWDKIAYEYLRDENFGKKMKKKSFYKVDLAKIISGNEKPIDRAKAIYEFVRSNMEWNGAHTLGTSKSLKKKFSERKGTTAEINLLLLSMLKAADFQAEPIILSTRRNGKVHPVYPLMDNFNYVVAQVMIDGKEYLLDATDSFVPFGYLPKKCLNYFGRKIVNDKALSYDIKPVLKSSNNYFGQFTLDEEGGLEGSLTIQRKGYSAIDEREEIKDETQKKYLESFAESFVDFELEEQELKNVDVIEKPLIHVLKLTKEGEGEDRIYLTPSIFSNSSNPFSQDSRLYPVDFGALVSSTKSYTYLLPKGFEVESLPEPIKLALPDKGGSFLYMAKQVGGNVQVVTRLLIKKSMFMPSEYQYLKELYTQMNSKLEEAIVIKKSTI